MYNDIDLLVSDLAMKQETEYDVIFNVLSDDHPLNEWREKVLFPEKQEKINQMLKTLEWPPREPDPDLDKAE